MKVLRFSCLLLPVYALAQTPPPEVDQALRARVAEFCQDHVDGKFTKAWGLVAEDSKEMYFSSNKTKFESFNGIKKIDYNDDFSKARVTYSYDRIWELRTQKNRLTETTTESWKVEDGKWVWYYNAKDHWPTPMGPGDPTAVAAAEKGSVKLPSATDLDPSKMQDRAKALMNPTSIDKKEVVFSTERSGMEHVKLHNGAPGSVVVELDRGRPIPGFGAELDTTSVAINKDAILTLVYKPQSKEPPPPQTIRLTVQPFNQVFEITVKFAEAPKAD
jgi:hypothetical protein